MPARSIESSHITVEFAVEGVFVLTGHIQNHDYDKPDLVFTVRSDIPAVLRATRLSAETYAASDKRKGTIKDFPGQFELTISTSAGNFAPRLLGEWGYGLYQQMLRSAARGLETLPNLPDMKPAIDRLIS